MTENQRILNEMKPEIIAQRNKRTRRQFIGAMILLVIVIGLGGYLLHTQVPTPEPPTSTALTHCDYGQIALFNKIIPGRDVDPEMKKFCKNPKACPLEIVVTTRDELNMPVGQTQFLYLSDLQSAPQELRTERFFIQTVGANMGMSLLHKLEEQLDSGKLTPICIKKNPFNHKFVLITEVHLEAD